MSGGEAAFSKDSQVRVRSRDDLLRLARGWRWQPTIDDNVLREAGRVAVVVAIDPNPDGGALYTLDSLPGSWDEAWLEDGAGGERRRLSHEIYERVRSFGESSYGAHTVRVELADGTSYSGVIVAGEGEVVRVAGHETVPFDPPDVVAVEDDA